MKIQPSTRLKVIGASVSLGIYLLKVVADIRKHKTHDSHHQICDCLGQCFVCMWAAATGSRHE